MKKTFLLFVVAIFIFSSLNSIVYANEKKVFEGLSEQETISIFSDLGFKLKLIDRRGKVVAYSFVNLNRKILVFLEHRNSKGKYLFLVVKAYFKIPGITCWRVNDWNQNNLLIKVVRIADDLLSLEEDVCTYEITENTVKANLTLFLLNIENVLRYFY